MDRANKSDQGDGVHDACINAAQPGNPRFFGTRAAATGISVNSPYHLRSKTSEIATAFFKGY